MNNLCIQVCYIRVKSNRIIHAEVALDPSRPGMSILFSVGYLIIIKYLKIW